MLFHSKIKNTYLLYKVFLLLTITFIGCQKIINIDLNDAAPRIVIEGLITNNEGPYTVVISRSGSYFNQPLLPPVSGAEVIINDNSGINDTLREIATGIYITGSLEGTPGRTYTLRVSDENMEYTGSTTMHTLVNIKSLNLIISPYQHFSFGGDSKDKIQYDIHCHFIDPPEKNFYRMKVFRNDTLRSDNYRLYDDQYTNGQDTELRVVHISSGGTYRIELSSLDKKTYEYYRTLEDLLDSNPFFGSTPANPNNNLDNGALGYFGSSAVSSKTIIVPDSLFIVRR